MKRKIAIVGSTSAVGIYLKKELEKENEIITIGRKKADIYFDLEHSIEELQLPNDIDTLICLSAAISASNDTEILRLLDINLQGALKLCIKAKENGISQIIFVSSISAILQPEDAYYGYYSLSKQCAEKVLKLYCEKNNINLCILRPSQIYGSSEIFRKNQPLLYTFIDQAKKNGDITIYGKNDALRNYVYIDDIVLVIKNVIAYNFTGTYSIINPVNNRLSEIAKAVIEAYDSNSKIVFLKDKPSIEDNPFYLDNELHKELRINNFVDIKEGIRRVARTI